LPPRPSGVSDFRVKWGLVVAFLCAIAARSSLVVFCAFRLFGSLDDDSASATSPTLVGSASLSTDERGRPLMLLYGGNRPRMLLTSAGRLRRFGPTRGCRASMARSKAAPKPRPLPRTAAEQVPGSAEIPRTVTAIAVPEGRAQRLRRAFAQLRLTLPSAARVARPGSSRLSCAATNLSRTVGECVPQRECAGLAPLPRA